MSAESSSFDATDTAERPSAPRQGPASDAARAEHRAAEILERVADSHVVFDRELRYLVVNAAAERSMRRSRAALLGRKLLDVFPSARHSRSLTEYTRVLAEGVEVHFAEHYVGDGLDNHIEVDAYPTDDGGIAVFWRELNARVEAETALRDSEARLRRLLEIEGVGILIFDANGTLIGSNDSFLKMTGYTRAEIDAGALTWRTMTPSAFVAISEEQMGVLGRTGRIGPYEKEYFRADGSRSWMLFAGAALGDGTVAEYCIDISQHKEAESALVTSETKYRTLFESIDEGFCVIEVLFDEANHPVDYRFVEANPAFVQQTGLEDVIGRTVRELVPTHDAHWFQIYGRVALTGESVRFEAPAEAMGRWYDVYAARIGEAADHRVAVLFTDRSVAKNAERERERLLGAIELERSRLAAIFAQSPSILALVRGPNHVLELANDAYLDLIGRPDAIGKPLLDAVTELRGQGFEKLLDAVIETGEPYVGKEVPIGVSPAADAPPETRYFDFVYLPIAEIDGTRSGVIAHGNDITEQVQARREAERLLAVSERARAEAEAAGARSMRLYALTAALSMSATPEEVAEAVIEHAPAVLEAVGVIIARTTADGSLIEIMSAGDMPDDVRDSWRSFPIDSPVPLAEVARTGEAVFLESRAEWGARYPAMAPLLESTGHHANAVAPLVVHGSVLGALGAAFRAPRHFSEVDRALVLTVAQQCAQALERARLFEAERVARDEAEAANRAKGEFLAVMSHELRTPLNAIGGYAELMQMGIRGPVSPQQAEDLRRIQASQRHLLGLVNEVLNYARIETGTVQYDLTAVPLVAVITSVEPLVAPQLAAKGLTYTVTSCSPAPIARADHEKVRQVVLNLLSNAVKFTDRGGAVDVSCDAEDDHVVVRVRDTGIGIALAELERVFEPFVQVNASLTRTQEGTGLGLAISRDLARGMGGDLTAISEPGVGSIFTLSLPAA